MLSTVVILEAPTTLYTSNITMKNILVDRGIWLLREVAFDTIVSKAFVIQSVKRTDRGQGMSLLFTCCL